MRIIVSRVAALLGLAEGFEIYLSRTCTTQFEVEKFQLSKGLTADGVVGQQTLAALQQALAP